MKKMRQQLGREEQAMMEVGRTTIGLRSAWMMIAVFLALIAFVPAVQYMSEVRAFMRGERDHAWPQCRELFRGAAAALRPLFDDEGSLAGRVILANRGILREMRAFEDTIDDDSAVGLAVRPPIQYVLARRLGAGNERAYCGRGDWLFFQPDVDYLIGPGFLQPSWLAGRIASADEWVEPPQPDPVKAILHFNEQLAERGIRLIVMPTPIKTEIHPEKFARAYEDGPAPLRNLSYKEFVQRLENQGVPVFDCADALVRAGKTDKYLRSDTHWRPETVERVAALLKDFIEEHAPLPDPVYSPAYTYRRETVSQLGDIALMLKLPPKQTFYAREHVEIRQVLDPAGMLWAPDLSADVLVLGDSFSNIYSQDALGWGEGAGLIEQLSLEMRRPLDRIVRNDSGAYATRAMLARELARGRDRLDSKRLVIYQFACRELTAGDWKMIELSLGAPPPERFVEPEPGSELTVRGIVRSVSPVPRPGSVPYSDHIFCLHLVDLEHELDSVRGGQAVVYMWSMRDNVRTRAARLRPDDTVKIRIRPWTDVSAQYGGINRSEPDDEMLLLQEPCWGELLSQ